MSKPIRSSDHLQARIKLRRAPKSLPRTIYKQARERYGWRTMAKDLKKEKRVAHYDQESDVLYLGLKEGAEDALIEVAPGVGLEVDESGKILGIEILNASQILQLVPKLDRPAAVDA